MLTLFHHSLPPWAAEYGGWRLEKTVDYFMEFTRFYFVKPFDCWYPVRAFLSLEFYDMSLNLKLTNID